jgi:hypothetical protein
MQVSADEPEHKAHAVNKLKKGTPRAIAEPVRRPAEAARRVQFTMTVNPDDSDAGVSGVMPTLSAYFEATVPDVDDSSQSAEDGEDREGENEDASSGESDGSSGRASSDGSASCTSPSNGDDDQRRLPRDAEKYVGSIGRIRVHLATSSVESALSEVVALLDGF